MAERLKVYVLARTAFEPNTRERRQAFNELYECLERHWQVFGSRQGPVEHWDADQTFRVPTEAYAGCSRESEINLLTVRNDKARQDEVLHCLKTLWRLKGNRDYPHRATSKFLHFFNPRLFPIWDTHYVWNQAQTNVFKADMTSFCHRHRMNRSDNTGRFNLNYNLRAAEVIGCAKPEFMECFAEWFREGDQSTPAAVIAESPIYYAAGFEMVMLLALEFANIAAFNSESVAPVREPGMMRSTDTGYAAGKAGIPAEFRGRWGGTVYDEGRVRPNQAEINLSEYEG